MPDRDPKMNDRSSQRELALARWDNEGGAGPTGPPHSSFFDNPEVRVFRPKDAEIAQLRVRVIALENLVIAVDRKSVV